MMINRRIQRTMELTADEVYAAIAAKYDLSTSGAQAHFQHSADTISHQITLVAVETYDQEIAP